MTSYTILKLNDEDQTWGFEAVNIKASSSRRALAAAEVGAGTFVAVPDRSWKPLTVKTEQVTKVTIG